MQSVFGDLQFSVGWKTRGEIVLFGKTNNITIKAKAYEETDGITDAQKLAFNDFKENTATRLNEAEAMLSTIADGEPSRRFKPRTLLFNRSGEYALLCDDESDPDDGVAVVLSPKQRVVSQDDYL